MNYRAISATDCARLACETRDLQQFEMRDGSAAILWGYHPLYGSTALILDGERYGWITPELPRHAPDLPGRPSDPLKDIGSAWAQKAALAACF